MLFVKKPAPVREQAVESVSAPVVINIEPEILEPVAASVVIVSDEQFKYARPVIPVGAKSLQMGMKGVAVPAGMVKAHSENLEKNDEERCSVSRWSIDCLGRENSGDVEEMELCQSQV